MADTVINQPPADSNSSDNGMGFVIGFIVLLILGILFFFYLIPFLGRMGGTQVNVPRSVDVNVNK